MFFKPIDSKLHEYDYFDRATFMREFTVLKIGNVVKFELDEKEINILINKGYKVIGAVEADSVGDARSKFESSEEKYTSGKENPSPVGYLKLSSNLFFFFSILAALILIFAGFNATGSYSGRRFAIYYFASGFSVFLVSMLTHSACKALIYIANKK